MQNGASLGSVDVVTNVVLWQNADCSIDPTESHMNKLQLFTNLVNMASLDEKFTDQEIQFLVSRAERWGIPNDEFETILVGIQEQGPTFELPTSQAERRLLLEEMIRLIASDGELADVEKELLATVSGKMEFSSDEFRLILDDVIRRR